MVVTLPPSYRVEAKVIHGHPASVTMEAFEGNNSIGSKKAPARQRMIHNLVIEGTSIDRVVFKAPRNEAHILEFVCNYRQEVEKPIPVQDFPYIMDFEPKKRELYESVTQSGETLSRSSSNLNLKKGTTTTDTTEDISKYGAKVTATIPVKWGSVGGEVSSEWINRDTRSTENVDMKTTDDHREKRETFSYSTSITQMYELFSGYHLGTNRALFFMVPRPHIENEKDKFTFINGPRKLEGIQEVFLVLNRPKDIPGVCIEAYLETGHRIEGIEPPPPPPPPPPRQFDGPLHHRVEKLFTDITSFPPREGPASKEYEATSTYVAGPGFEIDTDFHGGYIITGKSGTNFVGEPSVTVSPERDRLYIYGKVKAEVKSWRVPPHGTRPGWMPGWIGINGLLDLDVIVFLRQKQTVPQPQPEPANNLLITGRGISACVNLIPKEETSLPITALFPIDWEKASKSILLHHSDIKHLFSQDTLQNNNKVKKKVEELLMKRVLNTVPNEWLLPTEWITYETSIPVNPIMYNSERSASDRIRAANDLTEQIARTMIGSLGSTKRYRNQTVDFWHTKIALDELSKSFTKMPNDHPGNKRITELNFEHKDKVISKLGKKVKRKDLLLMPLTEIQTTIGINDMQARELKHSLIWLKNGQ